MKVKATIVAPEPPSPQTLADLPNGVKAVIRSPRDEKLVRWRDRQFVIGECDGFVGVMNATCSGDGESDIGHGPETYKVLEVLDPPAEKPETLADLDNGVVADVYLHPNPDHILRRWRSDDHVLGRNPSGCIEVKNSVLCGVAPKDYFVRKALGKFIVEFTE